MTPLSAAEIESYWTNGFLFLNDALTPSQLDALVTDFEGWVDESRSHDAPYGTTLDDRARFDLEIDHTPERPALRRIASPVEISDDYLAAMRDNRALDAVAPFKRRPHRGAVLPRRRDPRQRTAGSNPGHPPRAALRSLARRRLHRCGRSRGRVRTCRGRGAVHGSAANLTDRPRTLFICEYRAEDSKPLQVNHIPSRYEGEVVRGERTNRVRCSSYEMEFPEVPTSASFFDQQAKATQS